jgi:sugar transferase (PEP-CTERM/EpsH1 system associated)
MNILFVCHRYPYPPNRGGKIRPFNMILHLSQHHRVVVATLAHSQEELQQGADLSKHCSEVLAEVVPSPVRWMYAVSALPSAAPSSARYFHSSQLRRRIADLQSRMKIDAVIVHCAFMADYVRNVRAPFRMMDFGDLDSRKWLDYSRYTAFPFSLGYALETYKLERVERRLAQEFDHCTVTARGELESYRELGASTPCNVIPNGVDADYFHISRQPDQNYRTIVFLGRMDYFPNVSGVLDFVKNVFPLVRRQIPDAHLKIVGSNPVAKIRALENLGGISVTGYVPDVRPHVAGAAAAIAPLSIARGTQNKVLECMAMGIPVVASPQVAKGVQALPGRHLLVGANPQDFAAHVVRLLEDEPLRRSMAESARAQVVSEHSWPESMKLLDGILAERTGSRRAVGSAADLAISV